MAQTIRARIRIVAPALVAIAAMIGVAFAAETKSVAQSLKTKEISDLINKAVKDGTWSRAKGDFYLRSLEKGELMAVKPGGKRDMLLYADLCDLPGAPSDDPACQLKGGGKGQQPNGAPTNGGER